MKKVLIANRGEIAVRIQRTLKRLGILSVAVYSDADRNALFVKEADEAWPLGGQTAQESYLRVDKIMEVAKASRADAIHPGYGFLSEKLELVRACHEAGLIFIGPDERAIHLMGDKIESKKLMQSGGVPTIPGFFLDGLSESELLEQAEAIGYPVMVKAAAGGGGKGMRRVDKPGQLLEAVDACRSEALRAFLDDRVFVEKFIVNPRHIEVQVFGDRHGLILGLSERECSIQRRNQKILEECPSPGVNIELRGLLCKAAADCARLVDYVNAGTVEFVMGEDRDFYFLEMNTRLQVEHPVTELAHGIDLVEEQIRVARGLPLSQSLLESSPELYALECRVYAEDPANEFFPSAGPLHLVEFPQDMAGVRVDTGVVSGDEISIYYDPMIAKVITVGSSRDEAIERMQQALQRTCVFGIETNIGFLLHVLASPEFHRAELSTDFIARLSMVEGYRQAVNALQEPAKALAWHLSQSRRRYPDVTGTTDPFSTEVSL